MSQSSARKTSRDNPESRARVTPESYRGWPGTEHGQMALVPARHPYPSELPSHHPLLLCPPSLAPLLPSSTFFAYSSRPLPAPRAESLAQLLRRYRASSRRALVPDSPSMGADRISRGGPRAHESSPTTRIPARSSLGLRFAIVARKYARARCRVCVCVCMSAMLYSSESNNDRVLERSRHRVHVLFELVTH